MKRTRREFLKTGSMMAAGSLISPSIVSAENIIQTQTGGTLTKHELPKLPYAYDALEPYIDAKTMELHHSKHHQAYVTGLIKAEEELSKARAANDFALVQHWSRRAAFNGGGHFLHAMFWKVMAPNGKGGGGEPDGMLLDKIKEDFGDYKMFMENFSAAARDVEGGGWALLHYRRSDKRLIVLQVENQHKLSAWDTVPVLGIDVWEHAYYLKYQNQRAEYVKNWWNVVNWKQVADNLKAAM
ncbi:superoxide dismutase [bacterium]|nr:superoxide dismutase [bacterium]